MCLARRLPTSSSIAPRRSKISTASPIGQPVDLDCVRAVQEAAKLLESLGHQVEEAAPEIDGLALARCYLTMYYGQTAATVAEACQQAGVDESAFELDTRALALFGRSLTAGEYVASRHRASVTPAVIVASCRPTPTKPTNSPPIRTGARTRNSPASSATFATV